MSKLNSNSVHHTGVPGGGQSGGFEGFGGNADFSDFFNSMFGGAAGGGGGGRQGVYRGQDFNAELQLSLRDIAETHKRTLTVNGKTDPHDYTSRG